MKIFILSVSGEKSEMLSENLKDFILSDKGKEISKVEIVSLSVEKNGEIKLPKDLKKNILNAHVYIVLPNDVSVLDITSTSNMYAQEVSIVVSKETSLQPRLLSKKEITGEDFDVNENYIPIGKFMVCIFNSVRRKTEEK